MSQAKSKRALELLELVKQRTPPQTHQEFLEILSLFRRKQLTVQQVHERVNILLSDYPTILDLFHEFLPNRKPTIMNEFTEAVSFVNTIVDKVEQFSIQNR
ncbi:hypothetical protein EDD86DRAFT_247972 [Gorgonomyces haynaldii]|nr:hypothetical protein EDD86DRAFT_247972 [Gorgonomyces haynaldii]